MEDYNINKDDTKNSSDSISNNNNNSSGNRNNNNNNNNNNSSGNRNNNNNNNNNSSNSNNNNSSSRSSNYYNNNNNSNNNEEYKNNNNRWKLNGRTVLSVDHGQSFTEHLHGNKDTRKILRDFVHRFLRGFASGVCLHAGASVVTALLRNPFRDSLAKAWENVCSKYCLQTAMFLGLYPSVYQLMVHVLRTFRKTEDGWNHGISGALAGLSIAFMDESRRQTITFFSVSRALGAGISTMVARGLLPVIPLLEVFTFSACTSVIVFCTALHPEFLTPGYYYSIIKWSRDYTDKKLTQLFRNPGPKFLTCADVGLHPDSCLKHRLIDCLHSLPAFAKLYLPIHVTPILVFKRQALRKRPLYVLKSFVKNVVVSSSFLGLMVMIAKLTICLLRNHAHRPPPLPGYVPATAGALCAFALLLERYTRRKELSLFVVSHTLSILHTALLKSGLLSRFRIRIPHGFTLLFALAMMPVMHAYERQPESLSLLINGLLRFFIGQRTQHAVHHANGKA